MKGSHRQAGSQTVRSQTSVKQSGAREGNKENICESLIKIVTANKLKALKGLDQNGKG